MGAPVFRFFRAGGVDQVDLSDPDIVQKLEALDLKLWLALACPTSGLEIDSRTLELVDSDHDGRIRPPEVLAAVAWAREVFASLGDVLQEGDTLPLAWVSDSTAAGRGVRDGAKRVLADLGNPNAEVIRLEDISSADKIFAQTVFNGDGIVPQEASPDPRVKQAIADAVAVLGGLPDRSGKLGIDRAKADAFFDQVATYAAWLARGDSLAQSAGANVAAAFDALRAVRGKVDDYFLRTRLAEFDPAVASLFGPTAGEEDRAAAGALAPEDERVARWPLARVASGAPLPLREGVNPAWATRLGAFATAAVDPALGPGRATLTESEWEALKARFEPYAAWLAAKPDLPVGALPPERIRALDAADLREAVRQLIATDAALAAEYEQIEAVEKAIRFRRDLPRILRNFVNFADFYGRRSAIFQAGTLYIDGRSCELCLSVQDVGKHAAIASHANAYLLYCDCVRQKDASPLQKRTIVAAVTAGSTDNLLVGRNGVFFDRKGDNWDATVTRIVENPTSVREAFWSPYKRFVRLVQEQVAKRATAADDVSKRGLEESAKSVASAGEDKAAPKPEPKKFDVGTIAALGVAVGGFAAFLSSVLATFLGLGVWMPLGILALVLAISGPSMLIASLKLSQRNIGPLLDASGWAVNAFARVNAPFGAALTHLAELPTGAKRILEDPFATKRTPWRRYAVLLFLLVTGPAWALGKLDAYLPLPARSSTVLPRIAHIAFGSPPETGK